MTARDLALALDLGAEHRDSRWRAHCPLPKCSATAEPSRQVTLWDTVPDHCSIIAGCDDLVIVAGCGCRTRSACPRRGQAMKREQFDRLNVFAWRRGYMSSDEPATSSP